VAVYRPQYKDRTTGETKRTKVWYYKFIFAGRLVKESAKTTSKTVAKEAEKKRRRELEEGFNGITDAREERIRPIRELAECFLKDYLAECFLKDYKVRQPKSASFAEHALAHVQRLLSDLMSVDVTDKTILKYQTHRLTEAAAPKTINEEVGFLLRLLPVAHAGAIRAQLKQQKKLKLKVNKQIGKAYSDEEKSRLIDAAKGAKRSKSILLVTLLAQQAGMRDKEIRTLQWTGFDLVKRVITVGRAKQMPARAARSQ
jgi:integrase